MIKKSVTFRFKEKKAHFRFFKNKACFRFSALNIDFKFKVSNIKNMKPKAGFELEQSDQNSEALTTGPPRLRWRNL